MAGLGGLIKQLESSVLDVELLRFFSDNPYSRETMRGLANRLGRDPLAVGDSLTRLTNAGILRKNGKEDKAVYRYIGVPNQEWKEMINVRGGR